VQHGLLALALALIAAIVAALFAPAYVNWNDWRATFEQQASGLAGTTVRIQGPIEATILPTPAFVLRDVRIGDPEKSTGIQASEVRGTLSLGALLRGAFEAEEFVLQRPAIRLAVEQGGRILLPEGGSKAPDALAIARFTIENGSLTLDDRAGGALTFFDAVSASGEMRSRAGPMKLDASMRLDGRRWNLRASTGLFGVDGSARARILAERPDDGASLDADGFLAFTGAVPRFNGKLSLAHAKGAGLPWRVAASASANGDLVALETMELTLGAGEMPLEFSGNLQFVPRRGGKIEGTLAAKRLDFDRALGTETGNGLAALFTKLRETVGRAGELPLRGRVGISVDLLIANAAQVRELRGEIGLRDGFAGIENLEAKLPGRALLRASGTGAAWGYFAGDVLLEAEDPGALVRWALGPEKAATLEDAGTLRIAGKADWSAESMAAERLDFALGEANLGGSVSFTQKAGARSTLKTALNSTGVDLDLLRPLAELLWSGSKDADVSFGFQGRAMRLFGKELRGADVSLARSADGVSFERLVIENFDGLSGKASGKLADGGGRIAFDLEAARPGGIAVLAGEFGGVDVRAVVEKILGKGLPLKLSGIATGEGAKNISLEAKGRLADVAVNVNLRADRETGAVGQTRVTLEATEAGKLLALFGISPGPPAPGDGRLEIVLGAAKSAVFPLQANLSVPGADLSASGEIQNKSGRLEPRLDLKLDASDLRPALAAAMRASVEALAAKGTSKLTRSGDAMAFENLALEIGKTRASGSLMLQGIEQPTLAGKLSLDRLELGDLLALAVGSSGDAKSFWPSAKLGAAPLAGASGALDLEIAALGLTGAQVATAAKFKLKLGHEIELADFSADFAGGKLSGNGKIARGETISFDGRASLTGFEAARVLVPGTWKANARGKGNLTLMLSGSGVTPAALASRLSGQGTLVLENLEIDELDPLSIATVVSAAEKFMPKDESALIVGVNKMLARAPLKVAKLQAPLVAASGLLRTGKAIAKTGEVEVEAEASFDFARLQVDGTIELETAGLSTARPGLTVRWRGPAGAPVRTVDVSALSTAINLRAMERETKRLEQRDRTELVPRRP